MLLWEIDETSGFDSAWASIEGRILRAEGRASGLAPQPYWLSYLLETDDDLVHRRMVVEARWQGGSASLDLQRVEGHWMANGEPRADLAEALDCDLAACPLTNTMPIVRHDLHRGPGDQAPVMAFIEVPTLKIVTSQQRYTHLRRTADGGATVRYRSGSFQSDLAIDRDGFVVDYPQLGRRVEAGRSAPGLRAAGPGSPRPD